MASIRVEVRLCVGIIICGVVIEEITCLTVITIKKEEGQRIQHFVFKIWLYYNIIDLNVLYFYMVHEKVLVVAVDVIHSVYNFGLY